MPLPPGILYIWASHFIFVWAFLVMLTWLKHFSNGQDSFFYPALHFCQEVWTHYRVAMAYWGSGHWMTVGLLGRVSQGLHCSPVEFKADSSKPWSNCISAFPVQQCGLSWMRGTRSKWDLFFPFAIAGTGAQIHIGIMGAGKAEAPWSIINASGFWTGWRDCTNVLWNTLTNTIISSAVWL